MKHSIIALALIGAAAARPTPSMKKREVPQEHAHENILITVNKSLFLDNPDDISDAVFGLLGAKAAAEGAGNIADPDCLQQATADQAFTNAKKAGDVAGMTSALIYRALERNTGKVGLASVPCQSIKAVNPEIAALQQHQDPAGNGAQALNKQIAAELARQIASVGGDPLLANEASTFAPGDLNDATAKGNTCDDANDDAGCINTLKLRVDDLTKDEIAAAVAGVQQGAVANNATADAGIQCGSVTPPAAAAGGKQNGKDGKKDQADKGAAAKDNKMAANKDDKAKDNKMGANKDDKAKDNKMGANKDNKMAAEKDNKMNANKDEKKDKENKMGANKDDKKAKDNKMNANKDDKKAKDDNKMAAEKENKMNANKDDKKKAAEKDNKMAAEKENKMGANKDDKKKAAEKENKMGANKDDKKAKDNKMGAEKENKMGAEKENKMGANKDNKNAAAKDDKNAAAKDDKQAAAVDQNIQCGGAAAPVAAPAAASKNNTAASNEASSNQASSNAAVNFGQCSDPTIKFGAPSDGRQQDAFEPSSLAQFNHGSALNIAVISNFICSQLGSACKGNAAAVSLCQTAATAAQGLQGAQAANAFNSALGF